MDNLKHTETERLSASGQAVLKPCFVYSLCGLGIAQTTNQINIYDGFSTSDRHIMSLVGTKYYADFRVFPCPIFFTKGIYVSFATNASECFIQFDEIGP